MDGFRNFFEDLWNTDGPHLVPGTKRQNADPPNPYNFELKQSVGSATGGVQPQNIPIQPAGPPAKKMKKMKKMKSK